MRKNFRKGYTLTEMMMAVGIIGILFGVGAPILNQATKNFIMSNTRMELQTEARGIMYLITRNLRQAQNSTITISRYSNSQPYYSKITFTKQDGKQYSFYQKDKELIMQYGAMNRVLSKNLRYLVFTFPESSDMGIISISMTLQKNIYEGQKKALHMASEKVRVMN
ncbi:MAG: prepilin-type N-terminal cleavage/methylation domain-containing protein [Elusimicrobiota bacterium]